MDFNKSKKRKQIQCSISSWKVLEIRSGAGIGLYVFGGVGGFYFDPSGYNRFIDENGNVIGNGAKHKLRPLQTEGQSYNSFAFCIPAGFALKSFNRRNQNRSWV